MYEYGVLSTDIVERVSNKKVYVFSLSELGSAVSTSFLIFN